jgi:phthiocerol/phenolphthiocerol synthesis type-I polyketide synthase D
MTSAFDEEALRHWLADYLVTIIGCSPSDIDFDASMKDLGLGSSDAIVLSGELSELLGRQISPVEFWQHPSVGHLARFLSGSESEAEPVIEPDRDSMDESIAVIGLGCRFPGDIGGPEALWQFLCESRSAVGEVPLDRWAPFPNGSPEVEAALSGTTRWGSFLTEIDAFDADFFEISPREAARMDPQQRLLLEVAWEALEHAGLPADSLRRSQTGVFVGACLAEYGVMATADLSQVDAWSGTGGALSVIANRVSYFFDLRGPSVTVDTACSSSLVAVHLASQSLRAGDSNLAIVAGVNLMLSPVVTRSFDQAEAMSPTGQCHAFDAAADGFVRGEGCGVAVLKRLSDALRDGDRVLAVVRGSAVNQDGRSNGLMAPNPAAQMAVLRAALSNAGMAPHEVDYVEAHGTGTLLGDPIEARALGTVLGRARPQSAPLLIGAVKSNLGHLEAAAGIAGFIKTVLSLQRGHIPPNPNFQNPNPHIPFDNLHLKVVAEPTVWPSTEHPRRAGVSSFGFGGTNAHVVLEQGPDPVSDMTGGPATGAAVTTLVVSGKTAERVAATAGMLAEWMDGDGAAVALADVAHTLNHHRARHVQVATVCARDRAQAVAGLRALADGEPALGVVEPHEGPHGSGTVFVYSGQGSQWAGMGQRLLADEPAFAAAVAELEPAFAAETGFSLQQVLASGEPLVGIARIQPALVGMQLALTKLWRSYGVEPDAVIGHSMGEVTAAVVAGALTAAEGLRVIATRSRLMSRLAGQGAMALLEMDAEATAALIADYPAVTLAVYASPSQTVVAGPSEQVDAVIAVVEAKGLLARHIEVDVASHHPTIDPILPDLRSALADLEPVAPRIPLISTASADGGAPKFDADYWAANLRNPVRFSQAVATAAENHFTFIEVSPHPVLTYAIGDTLASTFPNERCTVTSAMKRGEDETLSLHMQLASLDVTAPKVDGGRLADVPPSPWLHSRYWIENRPSARPMADVHPLLGVHVEMPSGRDHIWQADIGTVAMPWLADHQVNRQTVMPVAGFAEMALAAGCQALSLPVEAVEVNGLEVVRILPLDGQTRVTTQLEQSGDGISIQIHASSGGGDWRRYAVASVGLRDEDAQHGRPEPPDEAGTGFSETEIMLSDEAADHPRYCIHPAMLDAALTNLAGALRAESLEDSTAYLPVSLATIRVFGRVGRRARCRTELVSHEHDGSGQLGRIILLDDSGTVTAELTGVLLRPIDIGAVPLALEQKVFETIWVESSMPPEISSELAATPAGSWLLLADDDAETKALVAEFTARLSSPARRVVDVELSNEAAVQEAVAKAAADPDVQPARVIVFIGQRSFDGTYSDGALRRARELIWAVSLAGRAVVDGWHPNSPRLWLVTRNGLAVRGDEPGDPAVGALKGLIRNWRFPGEAARFLADEPDVGATLVDVDSADGVENVVAALMSELGLPADDDVVAWRAQRRYVERLSRARLDAGERHAVVRADGSYIVTGGLGGLGTAVARWLVERGAGRLILNGRTEPSAEKRRELDELANGAEIVFVSGDVASPGTADRLVAAAEETGRPLRGLVHAAGVTGDGLVATLTREGLEQVWGPKATGALRLQEATAARQLDWWVGFSSMATLLGLPGQLAYTTANAWLDALMAWRRASGLPATAVNWGQWSDVGMSRALTYSVLDPITPDEGIEALQSLVGGDLIRVGVGRLRLDRAITATPEFRDLGYFQGLVEEFDISSLDNRSIVEDEHRSVVSVPDWSQLSTEDRLSEVETRLRTILAREMGMSPSAVNVDKPFPELGLDSMMAMTILREIRKVVGVELSANMLFNHPTIASLATHMAETLAPQQVPQEDAADLTPDSASSVLDELFDQVESASAGGESGRF